MPELKIGDEWTDGWGNYVVIDVHADTVETFDFEGVRDLQTHEEWAEFIHEQGVEKVTTPSWPERLIRWKAIHGDAFPIEPTMDDIRARAKEFQIPWRDKMNGHTLRANVYRIERHVQGVPSD